MPGTPEQKDPESHALISANNQKSPKDYFSDNKLDTFCSGRKFNKGSKRRRSYSPDDFTEKTNNKNPFSYPKDKNYNRYSNKY